MKTKQHSTRYAQLVILICLVPLFAARLLAQGNLQISTTSVPNGVVGSAYPSQFFAVSGGVAPYSWSIQSGSLPPGLTLTSAGLLSGTPTTPNSYNFVVAVIN